MTMPGDNDDWGFREDEPHKVSKKEPPMASDDWVRRKWMALKAWSIGVPEYAVWEEIHRTMQEIVTTERDRHIARLREPDEALVEAVGKSLAETHHCRAFVSCSAKICMCRSHARSFCRALADTLSADTRPTPDGEG